MKRNYLSISVSLTLTLAAATALVPLADGEGGDLSRAARLASPLLPGTPAQADIPAPRVVRSWTDRVKLGGRLLDRRVELLVDPGSGRTIQRTEGFFGLTGTRPAPRPPGPSPEEIATAFALVRRDPRAAHAIDDAGGGLAGGYLRPGTGDGPCGPGSRCLDVFAFAGGESAPRLAAAVDLLSGRVVELWVGGAAR